ncbi:hypothetical protein COU49_01020 [Candidatus Nomurabacteria bacterium CG10_big_fil_rev_8_21_14_0_10_35_16]|uniref:CSD domain-containing protein n=1 Tax=Candidatus Nomurabacteria bacterium CG10_big_fil_rev_8_21_14_0_10_35_16 TaxID=1974731 RepID=A0A2H0TBR0_9BACT|nr:MAG: hypothetical protein COU49_01020 [Candidatus Nomurabacteria bacterium CG10_big_fil_rev_8_21_14_0_10_35_16]
MKRYKDGCYSVKGIVISFNFTTARGKVAMVNGKEISFHSTSFNSGAPARFPKIDEAVEVIFCEGSLVRVRPLMAKDNETIWIIPKNKTTHN